ncbi:MAG: hypothetical protein DRN71_03465 [Candidatus Nanohalarchaeota archaeon]|nr:MAG: hypothetical protein DRN71_03465 [Candidatus Nanohaloarchaeota archaeon]
MMSEGYVLVHKMRLSGHQKNSLFTKILLIPTPKIYLYNHANYHSMNFFTNITKHTIFIILILFLIPGTHALECTLKNAPCAATEECIIKLSGTTDAHAEECTQSNYAHHLCCDDPAYTLTRTYSDGCATGTGVLSLFAQTDSHVEEYPSALYTNDVCLTAAPSGIVTYTYTDFACNPGYTCLLSMSDTTNAHLANCTGTGSYTKKICCKIGTISTITISSPKNTTYTETNLLNLNVSCHDSGPGCNHSSWRFSINNGINHTFLPNTTLTSKMGSNKLTVWIKNNADIWDSSTVYYTIDSTKWEDDFTEGEGISASENITVSDEIVKISQDAISGELTSISIAPANIISWDKFCANNTTSFIYSADNLIIDGTSMTLNGTHEYNIIKIINGGVLYVKDYDGNTSTGKLELRAKEIFIDAISSINANGKGHHGGVGSAQAGKGPGGGGAGDTGHPSGFGGAGAGYGGNGGRGWGTGNEGSPGTTYGDANNAGLWMGSGGGTGTSSGSHGGDGGGSIVLNAAKIIIEGSVTSNGGSSSGRGGGGSGGGINITADNLTVSGRIFADGSNGGNDATGSGGGGGGRITLTGNKIIITGTTSANRGSGSGWIIHGSPGSPGTIIINNNVDYTLSQGASITYNILRSSDDATLCSGLTGNNDSISLCAGSTPSIKLYAQLTASDAAPALYNWNVTWLSSGPLSGTINGTVTDDSGTPLTGAGISASDFANTYQNTTDALGKYTINNVLPSIYTLTATKSGLVPNTIAGIIVNPSATTTQDMILQYVPLTTLSRNAVAYFQSEKNHVIMNIGNREKIPITVKNPSNDYALVPLHIGSPDTTFKNFIHFKNQDIYPHDINITMKPREEKTIIAEIFAGKMGSYEIAIGPDNVYENKYDTKRITVVNKNAGMFAQSPGMAWYGVILALAIAAALLIARNKKPHIPKKQ